MTHARIVAAASLVAGLLVARPPIAHAGGLSFVEMQEDFDEALSSASAVAVSPDGSYIAVTARNSGGSVGVWTRNPATCELTFSSAARDGELGVDHMRQPTDVAITAGGACIYVTSALDDSLVVFGGGFSFERDGQGGVDGLNGANGIALSADGSHLYVTGRSDNAVAIFSRSGCAVTFVDVVRPVSAPQALALSPDDAHLYVAGGDPPRVTVFSRDGGSGALTLVEEDLIERVAAPASANAVSADGTNVYVTLADANAVAVFTRDGSTGSLTFLELQHGGGVKGIGGASGLAVSTDGKYVYVSGTADEALAVFARDATQDGRLHFLEVQDQSTVPDNALGRVNDVALTPDDRCVYAVGSGGLLRGSIAVFAVDVCGNGVTGVDEQCDDGNAVAGDGCSDTCRLELCGPTPFAGCRTTIKPGGASLRIRNQNDDAKDQLSWKWRGEATSLADFGDPTAAASYVLCVYDGSAQAQPLRSLAAPADQNCNGKPCWKAAAKTYKYKDDFLTPDGVKQVQLREGLADGKARLRFESIGSLLSPPAPLTLPVTVQVRNPETNVCWQAVYSTADHNDAAQFKAKSD